jgi:hypothetical protein
MVLESDRIPFKVNFGAAFCSWWIMAGFLVLPGAFMSLEKIKVIQTQPVPGQQHQVILTVLAACFFASGASGICYIWSRFRHNYVWLSNRLIMYVCPYASNMMELTDKARHLLRLRIVCMLYSSTFIQLKMATGHGRLTSHLPQWLLLWLLC